jgi:hypothetical protein
MKHGSSVANHVRTVPCRSSPQASQANQMVNVWITSNQVIRIVLDTRKHFSRESTLSRIQSHFQHSMLASLGLE